MKIAILTSGILPVPAVQGGAVENLVDFYLEYNDRHKLHDITVYSVWHPEVERHPALASKANHYRYVKTDSRIAKIRKHLLHLINKKNEYYHYTIEYFLSRALADIRKQRYDAIIIENRPGYALKLGKMPNTKLVFHLHNEKLDYKSQAAKEIYDCADRIITVSDYIANCVKTINSYDEKCITVHNGIDLDAFSRNTISIDRSSIGLRKQDFVIVFSGRLNSEKGILELIEAIGRLKDFPNIKLLVIGSSFYGSSHSADPFIESLKAKAANLNDRIIFTGFIPYEQMPNFLQLADVAAIPSVWDDPFPTTVLEAQAMGLPIIATRRGGIPEEVTEANAILLDTNSQLPENLANAILDLYQHPEKRVQMAEISLQRSEYYNKERYAHDFFAAIAPSCKV